MHPRHLLLQRTNRVEQQLECGDVPDRRVVSPRLDAIGDTQVSQKNPSGLVNYFWIGDGIDTRRKPSGYITVDDDCMQLSWAIGEWYMRPVT